MAKTKSDDNGKCPRCGYCPTCGRANAYYPTYPVPYYPGWWQVDTTPTITWGSGTGNKISDVSVTYTN